MRRAPEPPAALRAAASARDEIASPSFLNRPPFLRGCGGAAAVERPPPPRGDAGTAPPVVVENVSARCCAGETGVSAAVDAASLSGATCGA